MGIINYRELLKKYIEEVFGCESVTFIPDCPSRSFTKMTQEEIDELNKLADEQLKENT